MQLENETLKARIVELEGLLYRLAARMNGGALIIEEENGEFILRRYTWDCRFGSGKTPLDALLSYIGACSPMFKEAVVAPEWQPIDYSQSESGKAPFDGEKVFILRHGYPTLVYWSKACNRFLSMELIGCGFSHNDATHWMPVPEFMKGKK